MADETTKGQGGQQASQGGAPARQEAEPARRPAGGGQGALAPWESPASIRRMFDDFDRLFEDMQRSFFGRPLLGRSLLEEGFGRLPALWAWPSGLEREGAFVPRIDLRDVGKEVILSAELPGVDPKDVQIECTDEGITIRGESRAEETVEEGGIYRSERRYGSFYRRVPLPPDLDLDKARAEFRNGVLEVRLPKTEEAQKRVRRIPIEGAAPAEGAQPPATGQGPGTGGRGGRAA